MPGNTRLRAVRFRDERARQPNPWEGTVRDLLGPRHLSRESKEGTPTFSAVEYPPGATRGKRQVLRATALVLDFDHLKQATANEVFGRLAELGWGAVACTSYSHQLRGADDTCFRLLITVSRAIQPLEFEPVWQAVNDALGRHADPQARDISRIWYVASCPAERMELARFRDFSGAPLDVEQLLATRVSETPARHEQRSSSPHRFETGTRNAELLRLGGQLRRKGAEGPALLEALTQANLERCRPPLGQPELQGIVTSLLNYPPLPALLAFNLTDSGNAERFRERHGARFGYVHAWKSWFHFDGQRWRRDRGGDSLRAALDTLRATATAAENVDDEEARKALLRHALRSESSARLGGMLSIAEALLPVATDQLDQEPDLLNVTNGTIDLRTGRLRPFSGEDWLTRLCPVPFEPDAACPRWLAFLDRIMDGDQRLVSFLQRAMGYCLTGHTTEQVLFLLYGTGANGKSTFLETLRALLADYSAAADFTTFLKRDSESVRNDIARLVGTRMVSAVEAEPGRPLAEALVKQVTGGDMIPARFLFREFFEFKPQFKLWLAANHKPNIRGNDNGIWRRIRLVPFTVTIPESERDPNLVGKLADELPGILAWAVQGCLDWREQGLGLPEPIRQATASYREEMDAFLGFISERCLMAPESIEKASDLYAAYTDWCATNGERVRSQKALAKGLRERGLESLKGTRGVRCWRGLRLLQAP